MDTNGHEVPGRKEGTVQKATCADPSLSVPEARPQMNKSQRPLFPYLSREGDRIMKILDRMLKLVIRPFRVGALQTWCLACAPKHDPPAKTQQANKIPENKHKKTNRQLQCFDVLEKPT